MRKQTTDNRKKNRMTRGETLVETLASMVVITTGLTMLAGAITSTARLDHAASQVNAAGTFDSESRTIEETPQTIKVTVKNNITGDERTYDRSGKKSGELYYYE